MQLGHHVFIVFGLLVVGYMVIYSIPDPNKFSEERHYTRQCEYDTESLCPDCFPKPVHCDFFTKNITYKNVQQLNKRLDPFNDYLYRRGELNGMEQVVIKNVNPNGTIEKLRDSMCSELNIEPESCSFSNNGTLHLVLRKWILTGNCSTAGVRFCPPGDERGLQRFMEHFNQPELMTLLLLSANPHPLMIRLLSQHNLSVPAFVFQEGFLLVESHNGSKLSSLYREPFRLRLKIAHELINAFFEFDAGVDSYRFYLKDIHPDDLVVKYEGNSEVKILFANLKNVIILNRRSEKQDPSKSDSVYSRTEWTKCGAGCMIYDAEEICVHDYTDVNLYAVCKLLKDSDIWKENDGLLPEIDAHIKKLLTTCVDPKPSLDVKRYYLLKELQTSISIRISFLKT